MIKQLSLFGEEPVEAPKKAPVEVVDSTKPKPYRLVPPINIIEESSDTKSKKDTNKEGIAKNTTTVKTTVKKEKNRRLNLLKALQ